MSGVRQGPRQPESATESVSVDFRGQGRGLDSLGRSDRHRRKEKTGTQEGYQMIQRGSTVRDEVSRPNREGERQKKVIRVLKESDSQITFRGVVCVEGFGCIFRDEDRR